MTDQPHLREYWADQISPGNTIMWSGRRAWVRLVKPDGSRRCRSGRYLFVNLIGERTERRLHYFDDERVKVVVSDD